MSNSLVIISVIQGILLPLIVSFLKGQQWSTNAKFAFSIGISIAVAAATLLLENNFDWKFLVANAATVWASAQVVYQTWFKDTTVQSNLAAMMPWSKDGV